MVLKNNRAFIAKVQQLFAYTNQHLFVYTNRSFLPTVWATDSDLGHEVEQAGAEPAQGLGVKLRAAPAGAPGARGLAREGQRDKCSEEDVDVDARAVPSDLPQCSLQGEIILEVQRLPIAPMHYFFWLETSAMVRHRF
jgi:hypothetical protein